MKIIGLTGQAGHGKDTAAGLLTEAWTRRRGSSAAMMAFADPVKRECAEAFGVDTAMFYDPALKDSPQASLTLSRCKDQAFVKLCLGVDFPILLKEPQRPRFVMQTWGTEYRRGQDDGYWVTQLHHELQSKRFAGFGLTVVTDVRFFNECDMLKSLGATIWRINRPDKAPLRAGGGHQSEREIESLRVDAIITNDSIEALRMALVDNLEGL